MTGRRRRDQQRRRAKPQKADPALGGEHIIEINRIGRSGDGIASVNGRPVFVQNALPGDRLRIRLNTQRADGYAAEIIEAEKQSQRAVPTCPHFGHCGGCQLQHLLKDDYTSWKMQQVETALTNRGLADIATRPLIQGTHETRRRLRLAAPASGRGLDPGRHSDGGQQLSKGWQPLGFRARQSREIVPIEICPVALPSIIDLLPPLNKLLQQLDLVANGGELHLTATETGIDLLLEASLSPNLADLERLGAFAETHDLARLAWRADVSASPEPIAARRPARVTMGTIPVDLPIGAFLQATDQAEEAMRAAAFEAIGEAKVVADLFSGCGAFGLPLAALGRQVIALERDQAMVGALKAAARTAGIDHHMNADQRDLDRQPLDHNDLQSLDAAIVDPPRAGARSQVQALANSDVEKIAMVSCNPATFARDARLLIDGGYHLSWVQPIDAFLWSAQIELVGAFQRHIPS